MSALAVRTRALIGALSGANLYPHCVQIVANSFDSSIAFSYSFRASKDPGVLNARSGRALIQPLHFSLVCANGCSVVPSLFCISPFCQLRRSRRGSFHALPGIALRKRNGFGRRGVAKTSGLTAGLPAQSFQWRYFHSWARLFRP